MRGGSGRRVILDADSLCTKDIALYDEQRRPRNNSPLSLARMLVELLSDLDAVIVAFFLLALTAPYDTPVDHVRPATTTFTYVTRDRGWRRMTS